MYLPLLVILVLGNSCARPNFKEEAPLTPIEKMTDCALPLAQLSLCLQLQWESTPSTKVYSSFLVEIKNLENQSAQLPAETELQAQLWMPSMGHGSSPTKIEKVDADLYRVSRVFFIMPGEWEIRLQIKKQEQLLEQSIYKMQLP